MEVAWMGARSSDYSDWAHSILRTCSSFLKYRLIHFSNRCAPNITNPPYHCFFFFPNYSFSFKCKTTKTPNPKSSIHASIPAGCFSFALFCDQGMKRGTSLLRLVFCIGECAWFWIWEGVGTMSAACGLKKQEIQGPELLLLLLLLNNSACLALVPLSEWLARGMGSWPSSYPFGKGSFPSWSSSYELLGPWDSWGTDAALEVPRGKNGMSSHWEESENWEKPWSSYFHLCVSSWNLTTKSSHMPWSQQMPPIAPEINKRKQKASYVQ